jgi:hypothetical protein
MRWIDPDLGKGARVLRLNIWVEDQTTKGSVPTVIRRAYLPY